MRPNTLDDFWPKVSARDPDECWVWMAGTRSGYGIFTYRCKDYRAHRFVYWLIHSTWPPVVRHTCDNPPCCNPRHLLAGTQQDNVRDRVERGRRRAQRGQSNPSTPRTEGEICATPDRLAPSSDHRVAHRPVLDRLKANSDSGRHN
jgi:hypothetical protein